MLSHSRFGLKHLLYFLLYYTSFALSKRLSQRQIFAYGHYPTPAKGPLVLPKKPHSMLELVLHYEDNILYHAAWRVQLYYLLLIAYYKQHRVIQIDKTILQHGQGKYPDLQACHTSLFPGLIDFNLANISGSKSYVFSQSFFSHWNGMTVCCPNVVNKVDQFFEGFDAPSLYRKKLLAILCLVSSGLFDPLVGLQHYFQIMDVAFQEIHALVDSDYLTEEKEAARQVIGIQHRATFENTFAQDGFFYPKNRFFERCLKRAPQESLDDAYMRTQNKLLTGSLSDGQLFLDEIQGLGLGLGEK